MAKKHRRGRSKVPPSSSRPDQKFGVAAGTGKKRGKLLKKRKNKRMRAEEDSSSDEEGERLELQKRIKTDKKSRQMSAASLGHDDTLSTRTSFADGLRKGGNSAVISTANVDSSISYSSTQLPPLGPILESCAYTTYFDDPVVGKRAKERMTQIKLQRKDLGIRVTVWNNASKNLPVQDQLDGIGYVDEVVMRTGSAKLGPVRMEGESLDDRATKLFSLCPPPLRPDCFQKRVGEGSDEMQPQSSTKGGDDSCGCDDDTVETPPSEGLGKDHEGHSPCEVASLELPELFYDVRLQSRGKIQRPTPIQLQAWPILLGGKCNVLGIAPTGSGKTLAYGLPMVQACLNAVLSTPSATSYKVQNGPIGLVLAPTRELAEQIARELQWICRCADRLLLRERQKNRHRKKAWISRQKIRVMAVYGGASKRQEQMEAFQVGEPMVHIVAATPGRLLDLMGAGDGRAKLGDSVKSSNCISLDNVAYLVIDEADRMLQMGFREQIDAVSEGVRPDRLTSLFSATFPGKLADSCQNWVREPAVCIRASTMTLSVRENALDACRKQQRDSESADAIGYPLVERLNPISDTKSLSLVVGNVKADPFTDEKNLMETHDQDTILDRAEELVANCEATGISKPQSVLPTDAEKAVGMESGQALSQLFETSDNGGKTSEFRSRTEVAAIPPHVAQILHVCSQHKKPRKLIGTLCKLREAERRKGRRQPGLLIVFFSKIKTVKYAFKLLKQEGIKCMEFHGQLQQREREKTLQNFKAGKVSILLSTDIAARGIHVKNVEYIVNYDFPGTLEQYVHRCGRAGRSHDSSNKKTYTGKTQAPSACVYSFFTREFAPMAKDMLSLLRASDAWIDPNLVELVGETPVNESTKVKDEKTGSRDVKVGRKVQKRGPTDSSVSQSSSGNADIEDDGAFDCDDGQFSALTGNRIVLKRASHVSEAEESSSSSDEDGG